MKKSIIRVIVAVLVFSVAIATLSSCSILENGNAQNADVIIDKWIEETKNQNYSNLRLSGRRDLVSEMEQDTRAAIGPFLPALDEEIFDSSETVNDEDLLGEVAEENTQGPLDILDGDADIVENIDDSIESFANKPIFIPYNYIALPNSDELFLGMSEFDFDRLYSSREIIETVIGQSAYQLKIDEGGKFAKFADVYFDEAKQIEHVVIEAKFADDVFNFDDVKNEIAKYETAMGKASTVSFKDKLLNELPSKSDAENVLNQNGAVVYTWLYNDLEAVLKIDNTNLSQPSVISYYQRANEDNFKVFARADIDAYYTSTELLEEYSLNEIRAYEKLNSKYLQIEGIAYGVSRDAAGRAYINFGQHKSGLNLIAYFEESEIENLKKINRGDSIFISSFVGEVVHDEISSRIVVQYSTINENDVRIINENNDEEIAMQGDIDITQDSLEVMLPEADVN